MPQPNPLRDAALFYASLGWPVFPVEAGGKKPLTFHGCLDATTDTTQIKAWWLEHKNANVGIATGNGLVVVDVDHSEIPEGLDVPESVKVKTGKGFHYYYSYPKSFGYMKGGVNVSLPGIDIRGDGGYVVAPPSVHPNGSTYQWELEPSEPLTLASAPSWVTNRVEQKNREDALAVTEDDKDEAAWRPARQGERDARAVALAARLVKTGMRIQKDIARALLAWNEKNDPPVGKGEDDPEPYAWAMQKAHQALNLAAGNGGKKIEPVRIGELRDMDVSRNWIVEGGVLTEHSKTIVYGEPGTGKTFLGLQLAHAISSGTPFLDYFNVPTPKKVLYLSGENQFDDLKTRIENYDNEFHFHDDVFIYSTFELNFVHDEAVNRLRECIEENKIDVVIIDPLYIFAMVDEAKLLDVVSIEIALNKLIEDLQVSLVLLHHPTKDSYNMRGDEIDKGMNALRGAGWAMWAETIIRVDGTGEEQRSITFQKVRSGKTGTKYLMTWSENQVFRCLPPEVGDDAVLKFLEMNPDSKLPAIREACKDIKGCSNIDRNIERLISKRKVRGNKQKGYSILTHNSGNEKNRS